MSDYLPYHGATEQNAAPAANVGPGPTPINQSVPGPYSGPSYSGDIRQVSPPVVPQGHPQVPPATYTPGQVVPPTAQQDYARTYTNSQIQDRDRLGATQMQRSLSEAGSYNSSQRDGSQMGLLQGGHNRDPSALQPPPNQGQRQQMQDLTYARDSTTAGGSSSYYVYNVPYYEKKLIHSKFSARLAPLIESATKERDNAAKKAQFHEYTLNLAIALQVLLGSLTTGLSVAGTTGKQTAIQTTILGGLATVVASYLARARGLNEPQLSNTRVKELDHFIRDCQTFKMDYGDVVSSESAKLEVRLDELRKRFENLLGNVNAERKLEKSPV